MPDEGGELRKSRESEDQKYLLKLRSVLTGRRAGEARFAKGALDQPIGSQAAARALLSSCSTADHQLPTMSAIDQADGELAAGGTSFSYE
jgi:hypothetical protein